MHSQSLETTNPPISTIFVTLALSFNLDLLFKSWGVNPYNTAGAKKMRD